MKTNQVDSVQRKKLANIHYSIFDYQFGIKEGLETTYYENGNKKTEIVYKNGNKVSKPILWNESGSLIE